MSGIEITVHRVVRATPETVWRVLTDVRRAAEVLRAVTHSEVVEGEEYAVGLRWRETRRVFGKHETQEMVVSAVDPLRRTVIDSHHGGVHYRTEFLLHAVAGGTDLRMVFGGHHPDPNLLQRLTFAAFGGVGRRVTTRMMILDLADIAHRAQDLEAGPTADGASDGASGGAAGDAAPPD